MRTHTLVLMLIVAIASGLGGCQAGRTYELTPAPSTSKYARVSLVEGGSTVHLDPEFKAHFEREIMEQFSRQGSFATGDDLKISYRVIGYDPGSGPVRVGAAVVGLTGVPTGSLGMGTLALDVSYFDRGGREIGRIIADGPIDGPFGSTKGGLETAAESVARYTAIHFGTPPPTGRPMESSEASAW